MRGCLVALVGLTGSAGCGRFGFDANEAATTDATSPADFGANVDFIDDFDRPDGALGNGWVEHTDSVFAIQNHLVTRVTRGDWTTNHVSRPTAEHRRDLEIAIEFTVTDGSMPDWPQIFTRAVPSPDFVGYYVWVDEGPSTVERPLELARKPADMSWWTAMNSMMVPPAVVGGRYRLRMRTTGAHPVHAQAWYEIWDGSAWDSSRTISADDDAPDAMIDAGAWGFSGHTGTGTNGPYTYDNFTATFE